MERILVVDDEREIADLIKIYLTKEGYKVITANSGAQALAILEREPVQLLILDIMMPGLNGLELCRRVRRDSNVPIIFLSARAGDMDKVEGLMVGGDDYLTKPFNMLELTARVRAQLRRYLQLGSSGGAAGSSLVIGGLVVNIDMHQVSVEGREIKLTPTEFSILALLAASPGRVFPAEEIYSRVWQERFFDSDNTVMVHIRKLREKIEDNPRQPRYIKTVWGVGYKLEPEGGSLR